MPDALAEATNGSDDGPADPLAARCVAVSSAIRELFAALVSDREPTNDQIVEPALAIAETVVHSLAEIADGVQRLAAVKEAELEWAIRMQAEEKTEAEKLAAENSNPKRRFIGQHD